MKNIEYEKLIMSYDLVIVGTTAAALGIAGTVKNKLKTLILNETEMVAYEFVNTYKMPGVYSEGAVYYKKFKELGMDILLKTDVISITGDNGKYTIEIFNCKGFQTIEAEVIVDTTTERNVPIVRKSLNCLLVNQTGTDFPEISIDGVEFIKDSIGAYSAVIMKYECAVGMSVYEARHQLIDFWRSRAAILQDWKIASIGFCFEEKPAFESNQKDKNYILLPSAFHDSPSASIDTGAALGRRLV